MFAKKSFAKHRLLLLAVMALCLAFAQALEVQHDHQQLNPDCYFCQHAPAVACGEEEPEYQQPEQGYWFETTPYHRLHRHSDKRGKRDPPKTHEASA